jgi:hypothetical protein
MEARHITGGCQCGAVRFAITAGLGRAAVCHCRMCQKAFGNAFAPLVTAHGLVWTRGTPKYFRSSNRAQRGFCSECGTPLCYQPDGMNAEIAVGALDDPGAVPPAIQAGVHHRLAWVADLPTLPLRPESERVAMQAFLDGVHSHQHPDHD